VRETRQKPITPSGRRFAPHAFAVPEIPGGIVQMPQSGTFSGKRPLTIEGGARTVTDASFSADVERSPLPVLSTRGRPGAGLADHRAGGRRSRSRWRADCASAESTSTRSVDNRALENQQHPDLATHRARTRDRSISEFRPAEIARGSRGSFVIRRRARQALYRKPAPAAREPWRKPHDFPDRAIVAGCLL
jgi:hypothetical protein